MSAQSSSSSSSSSSSRGSLAIKPHSAPTNHNQAIKDPLAHFKAIPWCAKLLADPAILDTIIVDRNPLASGESNFVRRTMNSPTTVRACVTFFRTLQDRRSDVKGDDLSKSKLLTSGGGKGEGEDPRNPFLLFSALLDLGEDLCGFASTLHGGVYAVLLDEVMGTAANFQAPNGAYTVDFRTSYKRAVKTPMVVLVRGRVVKRDGRKLHVVGAVEDKDGNIMAQSEGIWVMMDTNVGRSQL
ncbi:hypothetical protein OQA88_12780 [Cercophora sp. LCS_1]